MLFALVYKSRRISIVWVKLDFKSVLSCKNGRKNRAERPRKSFRPVFVPIFMSQSYRAIRPLLQMLRNRENFYCTSVLFVVLCTSKNNKSVLLLFWPQAEDIAAAKRAGCFRSSGLEDAREDEAGPRQIFGMATPYASVSAGACTAPQDAVPSSCLSIFFPETSRASSSLTGILLLSFLLVTQSEVF